MPGVTRLVRVVGLDHRTALAGLHFFGMVVFEVLKKAEALAQVARRPLYPELSVDQEDVPHSELREHVSSARKPATPHNNVTSPISSCTTR